MADLEDFDVPDEMPDDGGDGGDGAGAGHHAGLSGDWADQMARMDEWRGQFGDGADAPSESDGSNASGPGAELEDGWEEVLDPFSGNIYYFESSSGRTTWHKPTVARALATKREQAKLHAGNSALMNTPRTFVRRAASTSST